MSDQSPTAAAPTAHPAEASAAAPAGKVPVTVLIPTLNESRNLPRCLSYLQWADEVVVVDSHSTDGTQRIAEESGARVIQFTWDGKWPKKRNWALRNADLKHRWILIVDADECIVPELAAEVAGAIKSTEFVGYYVNRRFIFLNKWIRHCGYYPSWNLRLFLRGHGEYEKLTDVGDTHSGDNEVHEHVVTDGPVGYLQNDMLHYAFPDVSTFIEKHNRYSSWEAAVQFKLARTDTTIPHNDQLSRRRWARNISRKLPFRPTMRFIYSYIIKRGFLDGRAGYYFCRLLATYELLSVVKHYELRATQAQDQPTL